MSQSDNVPDDVSLCDSCGCMTHTIDDRCGKCKAIKSAPDNAPADRHNKRENDLELQKQSLLHSHLIQSNMHCPIHNTLLGQCKCQIVVVEL